MMLQFRDIRGIRRDEMGVSTIVLRVQFRRQVRQVARVADSRRTSAVDRQKIANDSDRLYKNKLEVLWIIETKTGATKFVELSREKYDWLQWDNQKFPVRADWLKFFQSQIVWEKDKDGKYQFAAPK